jgi:predicted dehydrogenase
LKTRSDVQEAQLDNGMTPADSDYGKEPDDQAGRLFTGDPGQCNMQEILSPRGSYLDFYDALYQAITKDRDEPVTATDGVRVMQIIDAAFLSNHQGQVIHLGPTNRTNKGNRP